MYDIIEIMLHPFLSKKLNDCKIGRMAKSRKLPLMEILLFSINLQSCSRFQVKKQQQQQK